MIPGCSSRGWRAKRKLLHTMVLLQTYESTNTNLVKKQRNSLLVARVGLKEAVMAVAVVEGSDVRVLG